MNKQEQEKFKKAYRRLILAKPVFHFLPEMFGDRYTIEISEKDYKLLEPFLWGFMNIEYQVGNIQFSIDGRIVCTQKMRVEDGRYLLGFKDEDEFDSAMKSLEQCLNCFFLTSYGKSWKTICKEIKEKK